MSEQPQEDSKPTNTKRNAAITTVAAAGIAIGAAVVGGERVENTPVPAEPAPVVAPESVVIEPVAPATETTVSVEAPVTTEATLAPPAVPEDTSPETTGAQPMLSEPAPEGGVIVGHQYTQNPDGSTNTGPAIEAPAEPAPAPAPEGGVIVGHQYTQNPDGSTNTGPAIEAPANPQG